MPVKLKSFVGGRWHKGSGKTVALLNPASEEPLAETATGGIDFSSALEYARSVGGPALRSLTFSERAEKLQYLYEALFAKREEFIELSIANVVIHEMTPNSMSMARPLPCWHTSISVKSWATDTLLMTANLYRLAGRHVMQVDTFLRRCTALPYM